MRERDGVRIVDWWRKAARFTRDIPKYGLGPRYHTKQRPNYHDSVQDTFMGQRMYCFHCLLRAYLVLYCLLFLKGICSYCANCVFCSL